MKKKEPKIKQLFAEPKLIRERKLIIVFQEFDNNNCAIGIADNEFTRIEILGLVADVKRILHSHLDTNAKLKHT